MTLNEPVFEMMADPDDAGYWLVARDGGIFTFGNAEFHGSASGALSGNAVGMGATPTGKGYRIADSQGGVFPTARARSRQTSRASAPSRSPSAPEVEPLADTSCR